VPRRNTLPDDHAVRHRSLADQILAAHIAYVGATDALSAAEVRRDKIVSEADADVASAAETVRKTMAELVEKAGPKNAAELTGVGPAKRTRRTGQDGSDK
jgi:hypothetical protein